MRFESIDMLARGVRLNADGRVDVERHPMSPVAPGWSVATFHAATEAEVHGDHWEMHPEGDEVVVVLSGGIRMYLRPEDAAGEQDSVAVPTGSAFVVPRGHWHRIELDQPSRLMAITPRHHTRLEKRADRNSRT
jgi:mannose-6-phosphate isomerase-like protein (cupin superfamily)